MWPRAALRAILEAHTDVPDITGRGLESGTTVGDGLEGVFLEEDPLCGDDGARQGGFSIGEPDRIGADGREGTQLVVNFSGFPR